MPIEKPFSDQKQKIPKILPHTVPITLNLVDPTVQTLGQVAMGEARPMNLSKETILRQKKRRSSYTPGQSFPNR